MIKNLKWTVIGVIIGLIIILGRQTFIEDNNWLRSFFEAHLNTSDNVLIVSRNNNSIALDPAVAIDLESVRVTVNIYETLVKFKNNEIQPALAERWEVSEDGLIWTFHIREDVLFHDHNPLDADAVVFNFDRWRDDKSPYHAGHFVYWNVNFGGFPGFVNSVRAIDSHTVEIRLDKPYAPFLSTLAMPAFGIASPEAILKYNDNIKYKPVGTGPFIFKSWDDKGDITLDKNYNYWGEKAHVDQLIFKVITDKEKKLSMLEDGKIHIANDLSEEEIQALELNRNIQIKNRSIFNVGYLAFNMQNPDLADIKVRQAISHLIDQDTMIKSVFNKYSRPANTFIPPVLWGYNENIRNPAYDLKRAKALIADKKPITLKLLVMDEARAYFTDPIALSKYLKDQLALGGIDVTLDIQPIEDFLKQIQAGDYDLLLMGWTGDVADPDNFLYTFFSSENIKEGIVSNYAHYHNEEVDLLLTKARQATDQAFRISLYRKVQELIAADLPAIPLVHTVPIYAVNRDVLDYEVGISGIEALNHVKVEEE